jgi:hypothetical protein
MLKFFFQEVESERSRYLRTIEKRTGDKDKNEAFEKGLNEGLNYVQIATEISDYDVLKYRQVYRSVLLGDALIVYTRKLDERNKVSSEKFRIELMKLQFLGYWITGENQNLLEKYDETVEKKEKKLNQNILHKAGFEII